MAKVTPGFKLYLYQLLVREVGVGKQTMLPQVEDVLRADDILVEDLECTTMQELVEACPDFLKLTVFKKGRVYATVLRVEEWDQMLAEAPENDAQKKAASSGGGHKSWKKKKSAKKTFKPVKPGKKRREREAAEALAAQERAAAEAAEAAARAEREAAEAAAQEAAEALAAKEREAAEAAAPTERETVAQFEQGAAEVVPPTGHVATEALAAQEREAAEGIAEAQSPADEAKPQAGREASDTNAQTLTVDKAPEDHGQSDASLGEGPTPAAPAQTATQLANEPAVSMATQAEASTEEEAPGEPTSAGASEPHDQAPEPTPAPESSIKLTITYDPYEDMERELERQRRENPPKPERKPAPQADAQASLTPIPLGDLPQNFGAEVSCKDALLRALYQLLPYDVDPMAVLDEDWRMARATGSLSGSRNRVTFPLRYLHEDGTPITATLRKSTKNAFGKRWALTLVDGDDGTGESHLSLGFEGLPAADEGAWSDLSGTASSDVSNSPARILAQHVVIGTWERFLGALAAVAAPERWNYPNEGVGRTSRYGILREYIATTFLRALRQERLAIAADSSLAAFHTGLATPLGDDIYACLTPHTGDIPWKFAGFATAGSGELGARLTGTLSELPPAASYLQSLDDVVCDRSRMVIIDTESILGRHLGRLPHAFLLERLDSNAEARALLEQDGPLTREDLTRLTRIIKSDPSSYRRLRRALDDATEQAMRAAQQSYRIAAPVFDPTDNRTKLLVPLRLIDERTTDCALVLDLQPSGAYRAAAIMSLPRAYACARVVSREQPSWLSPDRVLG